MGMGVFIDYDVNTKTWLSWLYQHVDPMDWRSFDEDAGGARVRVIGQSPFCVSGVLMDAAVVLERLDNGGRDVATHGLARRYASEQRLGMRALQGVWV